MIFRTLFRHGILGRCQRFSHGAVDISKETVVVGMSGGVDSSVAAYLLHKSGKYRVVGLYMNNWDASDELGQETCPADAEFEQVRKVCQEIGIDYHRVNFVKQYWNSVFEPCLDQYALVWINIT